MSGDKIERGTILVEWWLTPLHECLMKGLSNDQKTKIKEEFPHLKKLLVAKLVLPNGNPDQKVAVGDILLKVNGKFVVEFTQLEIVMDNHVNQKVTLLVQRGIKEVEVQVDVQDLRAREPSKMVHVSGFYAHTLPFCKAIRNNLDPHKAGVYLCASEYEDFGGGVCVQSIDGRETLTLEAFIEVLHKTPGKPFNPSFMWSV